MALTYIGATSFAQSGPEQWRLGQFELDQMSVPFSGAATGLTTYVSSLTRGSAWSGDANMYLTGWNVSDSNKQYPTVTQEYLGAKGGVLPPAKIDYDDQVQSATSSRSASTTLASPLTVQYYAPSVIYSWITAGGPGNIESVTVPDPDNDIRVISLSCNDATFSPGSVIDEIVSAYFSQQIVTTFSSNELTATGGYYQNSIRKTRFLSPHLFDIAPGAYLTLYTPGTGYAAGDILTINGTSGYGTITVLTVGSIFGHGQGILTFTQDSATFTEAEIALSATGGSGSGAKFNVFIIS
jgi:hypothetical protein